MKKHIVLCADDYGQAPTISRGILELIQQQRLTATSCLVTFPDWKEQAGWLKAVQHNVDIGLHFNLTEGKALSTEYQQTYGTEFKSLASLIFKTNLRLVKRSVINAELLAQISKFQVEMGFLPKFLDGHQHVHQFPVVREVMLDVYEKYLRSEKTYVRSVSSPFNLSHRNFKKMLIQLLGGDALKALLIKHKIPHNSSFSGIYDFSRAQEYPKLFTEFLQTIENGGMIMCHPGLNDNPKPDAIHEARYLEYSYLIGRQFLADCEKYHVELKRFND